MIRVADLFSGGGGIGAACDRLAGVEVTWAANHWPLAVAHHRRRHPETTVVCQDLCQFDFRQIPDIDLLWASSACQGHSEAAQPARATNASLAVAHDHLRSTAWAVVSAVLAKQPKAWIVENVPEFREWAPPPVLLSTHAKKVEAERERSRVERDCQCEARIRKRAGAWQVLRVFEKGSLYRHWLLTFALAGYRVTEQIVNAAKFGVPQRRRRLILVGHLEREVRIREPRVAAADEPTLRPILDFDQGRWLPIRDMAKPGARARAEHADRLFDGAPCWGYHVSHKAAWGRSPDTPSTTVTTQNHHWSVRRGAYRLWTVRETAEVMGFPPDYFDGVPRTKALVMAGNAVPPPMAAEIISQVAASL